MNALGGLNDCFIRQSPQSRAAAVYLGPWRRHARWEADGAGRRRLSSGRALSRMSDKLKERRVSRLSPRCPCALVVQATDSHPPPGRADRRQGRGYTWLGMWEESPSDLGRGLGMEEIPPSVGLALCRKVWPPLLKLPAPSLAEWPKLGGIAGRGARLRQGSSDQSATRQGSLPGADLGEKDDISPLLRPYFHDTPVSFTRLPDKAILIV